MRGAKVGDVAEQREEQADTDPESSLFFLNPSQLEKRAREDTRCWQAA